ncbi:hypothetical protein [Brucella gallinifaecis]|uniref:hypothetical protein n=1 Tax=Brucella gallinifaecis TaxID=215590 RepID=UPI00235EC8AD|nr:hypothetical protein [Brucella gallinifaecis]
MFKAYNLTRISLELSRSSERAMRIGKWITAAPLHGRLLGSWLPVTGVLGTLWVLHGYEGSGMAADRDHILNSKSPFGEANGVRSFSFDSFEPAQSFTEPQNAFPELCTVTEISLAVSVTSIIDAPGILVAKSGRLPRYLAIRAIGDSDGSLERITTSDDLAIMKHQRGEITTTILRSAGFLS